MSIILQGRLTVIARHGRYGRFCVGSLSTDIGEFVVKEAKLDQFEEGHYTGSFVISKIYHHTYHHVNRMFIDICANVSDITLDEAGVDEGKVDVPVPIEPDPIQDQVPAVVQSSTAPQPSSAGDSAMLDPASRPPANAGQGDDLPTLFEQDEIKDIQDRKPIKLDPTVDRVRFRAQIACLKNLGYCWQAVNKVWQIP